MFSDNATKELAKTAYEIMTRDFEDTEVETPVRTQLSEQAHVNEMQDLANLLDALIVEAVSEYIGLYEEEIQRELNDDEVVRMSMRIMEEIESLDENSKIELGEALIDVYKNYLTED